LPGVRYDAYKLDYGCYVDLVNTVRAPQTLLATGTHDDRSEVPQDDYRAIRRAILDIDEFYHQSGQVDPIGQTPGEQGLLSVSPVTT